MRPGLNLNIYLKLDQQTTNTEWNRGMYKKHNQPALSQKGPEMVLSSPVGGYLLCNLPNSTAFPQNSFLDQTVTQG